MSQSNAQRTVNVIRTAVDQMTRDGAKISYRCGIVVNGGSSLISAYLDGDNSAISEDIKVYAGAYVNTGDYVIIGVSNEGDTWLEEVISYSAYAKLVLDYNQAQIKIGDGTSEPSAGEAGQVILSGGPTLPAYWSDNFADTVRVPVKNNTGSTLTAGTAVYINGVSGQIPTVTKASASAESTSSKTLGIISKDINDTDQGTATTFGILKNVNTVGYSSGDNIWLSTVSGQWTTTRPSAPDHAVHLGYIITGGSASAGRIFVYIQNGFELGELHNVRASAPEDGQVLVYDYASSYWKPGTASSVAALNDLTDVTITSPVSGNTLSYNGTGWVNSTPAANTYSGTSLTYSGPHTITSTSTVSALFPASAYAVENWDTDNWHSTSAYINRITPNKSGKMLVTASVAFAANATGNRFMQVWVNGTSGTAIAREQNTGTGSQQTWLSGAGVYDFDGTTDYVEVYVAQNSGGNLEVVGGVVTVQLIGGLKGDTGATGATGPAGPEGGTTLVTSSTATNSSVADAATAQTILASNASRKGFSVFNDSDQVAYLKFGSAATTTDFTIKLAAYGFYEMFGDCLYTGVLTAIWANNSTGSARVAEW